MARTAAARSPLEVFSLRQTELNRFLWTTELVYGIVKQDKLLENLPQGKPAWEVLSHVRSEAWFPTAKSRRLGAPTGKYSGTVAQMREQVDRNIVVVLWSVAAMFIAEYETYVETRFPGWFIESTPRKGVFMIPRPTLLLKSLRARFGPERGKPIAAQVVLKADLMKKIRNLYVHKGLSGIPREVDDPELAAWVAQASKDGPYPQQLARSVLEQVIGQAVDKSKAAGDGQKRLGEEFFYALFTFTNIRNFVLALDAAFPPDPAPT
jgi:hypothetical protein